MSLSSYNELFHSAENPDSSCSAKIKDRIHPRDLIGSARRLDILVREIIGRKDGELQEDIKERIGRLKDMELRMLPNYLLFMVEFYQIIKNDEAMRYALEVVGLIENGFGVPVNRYDMSSN